MYERGELSTEEYFEQVCKKYEHKPSIEEFTDAINDIFWTNDLILPIVRKLAKLNFPRGIVSNTNPSHWSYIENAFPRIWNAFEDHKLASFNVGTLKPFPEIFEAAYRDAKRSIADLKPDEILFIDDTQANIEGAAKFGFQTIHYVNFDQFLTEYKKTDLPVPSRYLGEGPFGLPVSDPVPQRAPVALDYEDEEEDDVETTDDDDSHD